MPYERYTYRDFRFANFPEIFSDASDAKMVLKKFVSRDRRISNLTCHFNIDIFRALTDFRSLLH